MWVVWEPEQDWKPGVPFEVPNDRRARELLGLLYPELRPVPSELGRRQAASADPQ